MPLSSIEFYKRLLNQLEPSVNLNSSVPTKLDRDGLRNMEKMLELYNKSKQDTLTQTKDLTKDNSNLLVDIVSRPNSLA